MSTYVTGKQPSSFTDRHRGSAMPHGVGRTVAVMAPAENRAAVTLNLSSEAKAWLGHGREAPLGERVRQAPAEMSRNFDELVQRRTDVLAERLLCDFAEADIPLGKATSFKLAGSGKIIVDTPAGARGTTYFETHAEVADELRAIADLNALRAVSEVLRRFTDENRAAGGPDERTRARERFVSHSQRIQAVADTVTLADGKLVSSAIVYAAGLGAREAESADAPNPFLSHFFDPAGTPAAQGRDMP